MESRIREYYICGMKSIKISDWIHKEMKIVAAKDGVEITKFSEASICAMMRLRGHKFTPPKPIHPNNKAKKP